MSARVTWTGLDQLRAALRALPFELAADARHIVEGTAERAKAEIAQAYQGHHHSGNLEKGLTATIRPTGSFGANATVRNRATHAHWFEYGTQIRKTGLGWNRGRMPSGNVFLPRMQAARRRMYQELIALVRAAGFEVSGQP
jgi:hypothetical protein